MVLCCRRKVPKSAPKLSFGASVHELYSHQSARTLLASPSAHHHTNPQLNRVNSLVRPLHGSQEIYQDNICEHIPIIHPFGQFRSGWDGIVLLTLIYTAFEVPYTLTFGVILSVHEASGLIALAIDIFLLIDLVLNFRTAYVDRYDHLHIITSPKAIAKRYLKSWFFVDLISSLPLEFIMPLFLGSHITNNDRSLSEFFKVLRIFRLLRGLKMLRVLRIFRLFNGYGRQLHFVRETAILLKCVKCLAAMLITAHYFACFWYLVGYHTERKGKPSWLQVIEEDHPEGDASNFTKYSYSWYWAIVTLFTTGYGDIVAHNEEEQWTASACILIGTCFFAYFIGVLTTLFEHGDKVKMFELERVEEAQFFCEHHRLPRPLTMAIISHVRYYCNYNYVFNDHTILSSLPTYLQNHIYSHLSQSLAELDIFKHLPAQVVGAIALRMTSTSCNSGHTLFRKGELSHDFFIQRTGRSILHIQPYKIGQKTRIIERGDVCGEYVILSGKHRDTVKCLTWSEFYVLDVNELVAVLRENFLDHKAFHRAYTQIKMVLRKTLKKATPRKVKFKEAFDEHGERFIHGLSPDAAHSTLQPAISSCTTSPRTSTTPKNPPPPTTQIDDLYHKMSKPAWSSTQRTQSVTHTHTHTHTAMGGTGTAQQVHTPDVVDHIDDDDDDDNEHADERKSNTNLRRLKSEHPQLQQQHTPQSYQSELAEQRDTVSNLRVLKKMKSTFSTFLARESSVERHGLVMKKPNAYAMDVQRLDTTHHEFEYSDHEESHFHRDTTSTINHGGGGAVDADGQRDEHQHQHDSSDATSPLSIGVPHASHMLMTRTHRDDAIGATRSVRTNGRFGWKRAGGGQRAQNDTRKRRSFRLHDRYKQQQQLRQRVRGLHHYSSALRRHDGDGDGDGGVVDGDLYNNNTVEVSLDLSAVTSAAVSEEDADDEFDAPETCDATALLKRHSSTFTLRTAHEYAKKPKISTVATADYYASPTSSLKQHVFGGGVGGGGVVGGGQLPTATQNGHTHLSPRRPYLHSKVSSEVSTQSRKSSVHMPVHAPAPPPPPCLHVIKSAQEIIDQRLPNIKKSKTNGKSKLKQSTQQQAHVAEDISASGNGDVELRSMGDRKHDDAGSDSFVYSVRNKAMLSD